MKRDRHKERLLREVEEFLNDHCLRELLREGLRSGDKDLLLEVFHKLKNIEEKAQYRRFLFSTAIDRVDEVAIKDTRQELLNEFLTGRKSDGC